MKKLSIVLMVLVLCLSMSGFTAPQAYDAYEDMLAKMADVTSMETKMSSVMNIGFIDVDVTTFMDIYAVELINEDGKEELMMRSNSYDGLGTSVVGTSYYKDGVMYTEMEGLKYKMDTDVEDGVNLGDLGIKRSDVLSTSIGESAKGTRLTFNMNPASYDAVIGDALASIDGIEGMGMAINSVSISVYVDDDSNLKGYDIEMEGRIGVLGEFVIFTYDVTADVVSINEVTSIDFPSDLDSYQDLAAAIDEAIAAADAA